MDSQSFLIFNLHGLLYGVNTLQVREIIYLPALTAAVEAPADIVGILNLRGRIVPVMNLDMRFGRSPGGYHLSDHIIIVEWESHLMGVIVSQVYDVKTIDPEAVEVDRSYGRDQVTRSPLVMGIARLESDLIALLHIANLIQCTDIGSLETEHLAPLPTTSATEDSFFWPNATPEERQILQQRAQSLMERPADNEFIGLMPLAVVGINGECFGLDLAAVREFAEITRITPVPCTPSYIVGNMNLRGEIVTLIDLSPLLHTTSSNSEKNRKAIVAQVDEVIAGVTVDEVLDVVYVHTSQIKPLPTTVQAEGRDYLRGTAPYQERTMTLLDLPKVLTQKDLIVDEQP